MKPAPQDLGELARMMKAFNDAFEKLSRSHESLERHAAELQRELDQKRKMALLGEVSAAMAHEIRNPLGGIQIYAEMLRRDLAADAEKAEILDKIVGCVRDLDRFVTDILTYAGNVHPRRARVPLASVLDRCVALAAAQVARDYRFAGEVEADAGLLERAFLNLIRNAVEAGGGVRVETEANGSHVVVRVRDGGRGIAPEDLDKLFTPFFTRKAQGTGLGLALAQKMVQAHGGEVRAANNDPPPGATFEVRLPR